MGLMRRFAKAVASELGAGETPAAPAGKHPGGCPQCGAPRSAAEESSGFGPVEEREVICGRCAYVYPKGTRVSR